MGLWEKYWIVVGNDIFQNPQFTNMQDIGLHRDKVMLTSHNPKWDELFEIEKEKISSVLGKDILVEHIGSTAIPNILAKPIIGILVGTKSLETEDSYIKKLAQIGYHFDGPKSENKPMLFIKADSDNSLFHLHITQMNSPQWVHATGFRDYLNNNKQVAKEYENLKIELAKKFANDRIAYKKGKEKFILDIYKKIIK